jgi:hypothetical protein
VLDAGTARQSSTRMTSNRIPPRSPTPRPAAGKLAARLEREAAALRANLRKRKAQARARDKPKQE